MKRFLTLIFLCFMAVACSSMDENRETRSTVYVGQTTWDLFENFGAPTHAIRISPEEVHFIYRREEATREWGNAYFDWCDMLIVAVDDHIVDWEVYGNQCYLNVGDEVPVSSDENERENLVTRQPEPRVSSDTRNQPSEEEYDEE